MAGGKIQAMFGGVANLFSGGFAGFAGDTLGLIKKVVRDKDKADELDHIIDVQELALELEKYMVDAGVEEKLIGLQQTAMQGVHAVNLADAQSKDKVQRRWRPYSCLALVACVVDYFVITPKLRWLQSLYWPDAPVLPDTPNAPTLLWIVAGILGLNVGARTFEKIKGVAGR